MKSLEDFKPFSEEGIECPYPFYEKLRSDAPVYEAAPGVFFIGSYELINNALRDPHTFKSGEGAAFLNFQGEAGLAVPTKNPTEIQEILSQGPPDRDTLLSGDPPAHTRFRSLVNRSLSPGRVARWTPVIQDVVDELIDAFIDAGEVELVSQYSMLVPLTVVSLTLGVPNEDRDKYKDWSIRSVKTLAGQLTREEALDAARASTDLGNYIAERVESARKDPQENVIGDLVRAHLLDAIDGDEKSYRPLDTPEIVSIVRQLLVAGQETVNYLISSLMLMLIRHPEQMQAVQNDFSLIPQMVEEGIRAESPIQALGRFATKDVEFGGVMIPAGSRVVMLYGCANRDGAKFDQAESFDIFRDNVREHVGFGAGPHYCIGSALARLESRIAFERLFSRIKNIRLAEGKNDFRHNYSFIFRALKELHLEFDKA